MDDFGLVRHRIRERLNDLADAMAAGACEDFSEYRYFSGHIRGLAEAESILLEVESQLEDADGTSQIHKTVQ